MIRVAARRLAAAMTRRDTGCAAWRMSIPSPPRNQPKFAAPVAQWGPRLFSAQPISGKGEDDVITGESSPVKIVPLEKEEEEPDLPPAMAREAADAEEFKARYETMQSMSSKLQQSMAAMGALQLLGGWYIVASQYQAHTLYFFFTGLSATLSFQMTYLLRSALKPPVRLADNKVLTLPLVSVRSMANFLARTHLIVCISATGLAAAFAYEVVPTMV